MSETTGLEIAIIGMAGAFPRARNLEQLWERLAGGEDCVTRFSDEELVAAGNDPESLGDPNLVKVGGPLEGAELCDASFFNLNPRDAQLIDPQHRVMLECAWQAFENAGYDAEQIQGAPVGIYAGCGSNNYFVRSILANPGFVRTIGGFPTGFGVDKDHLATLIAYKLGLEGPSVTVQTACSTALVATHLASQALLNGECDYALAGGVTVNCLPIAGYMARDDGFYSPSGQTRTFDARADGTVPTSGVGVVVLKRLEDALADRDTIWAVIKGSAVGNDGGRRAGYTAPRVDGQAKAVKQALIMAEVDPDTLQYVECHGSATALGDPVEVAGLSKAFRATTKRRGYCALGSVKSNIGHAGAAAGVAGLIKTVLALRQGRIPPTVHFEEPNPRIDFDSSPFYVNTEILDWPAAEGPRRAGVTSLGLGGTNAHVVLEEAPPGLSASRARPVQLLVLSARTESALESVTERLSEFFENEPRGEDLADVTHTLKRGRRAFDHRRVLVARDRAEAARALAERDPLRLLEGVAGDAARPFVFLFPGLGEQYVGMGRDLYAGEEVFRVAFDACADSLCPELGEDLRELVYPRDTAQMPAADDASPGAANEGLDLRRLLRGRRDSKGPEDPREERLTRTRVLQPAMFAVEYALAKLWMSWGVEPAAMVGYSLGEYTAACLSGIFSLDDALTLVARRAQMIEEMPPGAMLAVPRPAAELAGQLGEVSEELSIAAVNGRELSVVAGSVSAIEELEKHLGEKDEACRRLGTRHAFHSPMMEPIAGDLRELVSHFELREPEIPFLSNVTGTWMSAADAVDPAYWARHLCRPVRFADALETLFAEQPGFLLEIGPGQSLSSLALQHEASRSAAAILPTMRGAFERRHDLEHLLTVMGKLWLAGARIDWSAFYGEEKRRRVALPTYPFERRRYFVEPTGEAWWSQGYGTTADPGTGEATAAEAAAPGTTGSSAADQHLHPRPSLANVYAPPRDEDERLLVELWQNLIGVGPVGIHDNFFELGGHSLAGTQLLGRLERRFEVHLPLRVLFEHPTVVELAAHLRRARASTRTASRPVDLPPLEPRSRAGELPLSFAQERLWFLEQMADLGAAYNIPGALRVRGTLSIPALAAALGEITRRHEILRTTFASRAGQPRQLIDPRPRIALTVAELAGLDALARDRESRRQVTKTARQPFDLASGPLLRVAVLQVARDEAILVFVMHHIISDGWSIGLLVDETVSLLSALAAGTPPQLPELPVQYVDWAAWQKKWLRGELLAGEIEHWRQELASVPFRLDLPTDRPRPPVQTFRGARIPYRFSGAGLAALEAWTAERRSTLFVTLLAAFQVLLGRLSGQPRFAVGSPIAGRSQIESEKLIGLFVNMLVLRADLTSAAPQQALSFASLVDRLHETVLEAHAHQDLPFEKLVEELQPRRDPSRPPLFQAVFIFENTPRSELEIPGLSFEQLPMSGHGSRFDLTFLLYETKDGLEGNIELNTDLFDVATVERFLEIYSRLLKEIPSSPADVGRMPAHGDIAQEQLLRDLAVSPSLAVAVRPAAPLAARPARETSVELPSVRELRRFLGELLPEHMIPSELVYIERFPQTSSGKRDLGALPAPESLLRLPEKNAAPPATPIEELLADSIRQLLGVDEVSRDVSFFELGGHSLAVTRLLARARDLFGVEIDLPEVFLHPTIRELAALIDDPSRVSGPRRRPIEPRPAGETSLPLSFHQERLWILHQLDEGSPVYNIPSAVRLRGDLSVAALSAACGEIVRRHEILRTAFVEHCGEPRQEILPPSPLMLPVCDLRALPEERRPSLALELARRQASRRFDLSAGRPIRITLIQIADDDWLALVVMHHIVTDGWSWGVFVHELGALYRAAKTGEPSPLAEPRLQYGDFALWQRRALDEEALAGDLEYWRERLEREPTVPPSLPLDRRRPRRRRSTNGADLWLTVEAGHARAIEDFSRRHGVTLYMTLLSAFKIFLARQSGAEQISVGTQIAGRKDASTEALIGFFVNTLLLRTDLAGDPTFEECLARVRQTTLGAYRHQELPFERVLELARPPRTPSRTPLFDVMFVLQNAPLGPLELPGLEITPELLGSRTAMFDLTVTWQKGLPEDSGAASEAMANEAAKSSPLYLKFEYDRDLFDIATIERFGRRYLQILRDMVKAPDRRLSELGPREESATDRLCSEEPASSARPSAARSGATAAPEHVARLKEIWREILDIDDLASGDDFFGAGGTSVGILQVRARLEDEHGISPPLRLLFEETTLIEQAKAVFEGLEAGTKWRSDGQASENF